MEGWKMQGRKWGEWKNVREGDQSIGRKRCEELKMGEEEEVLPEME